MAKTQMRIEFIVEEAPGVMHPRPSARMKVRIMSRPQGGHYPLHYPPEGIADAKANIQKHALLAMRNQDMRKPTEEPVAVYLIFFMLKPKSRQGKYADKYPHPNVKPDIDNHVKLVLDALNKVIYHDDACVCELFAKQVYVTDGPAHTFIGVRNLEDWEAENPLTREGASTNGFGACYPRRGMGF